MHVFLSNVNQGVSLLNHNEVPLDRIENSLKKHLSILIKNSPQLFSDEEELKTIQRLRAVTIKESGVVITFSSDGMSLDDKILVEVALIKGLYEDFGEKLRVSVNFKRSSEASGSPKRERGPKPVVNRKSAFGLNMSKRAIPGVKNVIVVASGKGGVGKSTISTNLSAALAKSGHSVGLMDADIYGPSAPLMLGLEGSLKIGPDGKIVPLENYGVSCVSFGFFTDSYNPVMWRGPMVDKAIRQFCYDVNWGELDYLVVDLPPGTGDVQLSLIEKLPIAGAVIVTTPQDVALIDAHKALTMFEKLKVPVIGVVENMAMHICEKCGHKEHIFGEDSFRDFLKERKLKLLAQIPLKKSVRLAGDTGKPAAIDGSDAEVASFMKLSQGVADFYEAH